MAAKIRLARRGKRSAPFYHVVAADNDKCRDGRFIEVLGTYDPRNKEKGKHFTIKKERYDFWVKNGARPTETVSKLVRLL